MSPQKTISNAVGLSTMASAIEFIDSYNYWMIEKLAPYLGASLLEIGTGRGNFRKYFPNIQRYISVDIDADVISRATERYPDDVFLVADVSKNEFLEKLSTHKVDTILCANVIEHIYDDALVIRNMLSVLRPNGYIFLFVPALPFLYNDFDRLAGHYRRYTKSSLKKAVENPEYIVSLEYFNPIGALGWWVNKFFQYDDLDKKEINSQVLFFDKYIVPISKFFNPLTKGFFGQSLICIIRKEE